MAFNCSSSCSLLFYYFYLVLSCFCWEKVTTAGSVNNLQTSCHRVVPSCQLSLSFWISTVFIIVIIPTIKSIAEGQKQINDHQRCVLTFNERIDRFRSL